MKIFGFFLSVVFAIDSTLLMLMMQQNSVANPNQANQMGMMLPLLLLDDKDAKSAENKNLLIMMMMQGGEMGDTQSILPLLLLGDGDLDFKSFFLYSNMLRQGNLLTVVLPKLHQFSGPYGDAVWVRVRKIAPDQSFFK